jgi:hypothetical protein
LVKIANIEVPQGLGDIFWVYRKVLPYFDVINFKINILPTEDPKARKVQRRSGALFNNFPKVNKVTTKEVSLEDYRVLINSTPRLKSIIEKGDSDFAFICNRWLEQGNYLENLDKDLDVAWDFELPLKSTKLPAEYIVLYASGDTRHLNKKVWHPMQWALLAHEYLAAKSFQHYEVILVGASFDLPVMESIKGYLKELGVPTSIQIDLKMEILCYIIKNAQCFLGYQSGLNVLTDHLDTKQLMVYFDSLPDMKDSWVKPSNRGKFAYTNFKDSVAKSIIRLG